MAGYGPRNGSYRACDREPPMATPHGHAVVNRYLHSVILAGKKKRPSGLSNDSFNNSYDSVVCRQNGTYGLFDRIGADEVRDIHA